VRLTYTLFPGPVTRHEIAILPLTIHKVLVWNVIDPIGKIRVRENVVDNLSRITVPKLVFGGPPLWCWPIFWVEMVVLGGV